MLRPLNARAFHEAREFGNAAALLEQVRAEGDEPPGGRSRSVASIATLATTYRAHRVPVSCCWSGRRQIKGGLPIDPARFFWEDFTRVSQSGRGRVKSACGVRLEFHRRRPILTQSAVARPRAILLPKSAPLWKGVEAPRKNRRMLAA
jgi:hypothetical protein